MTTASVERAMEDLGGRSALSLLASRGCRRALYVTAPSQAVLLDATHIDRPRRLIIDDAARLPFQNGALDLVVLDAEMRSCSGVRRSGRVEQVGLEIRRVLGPHGECLLLTRTSRVPADRRAWGRYRLTLSGTKWMRAIARFLPHTALAGELLTDGSRVTELRRGARKDTRRSSRAEYTVTSFRTAGASPDRILDLVLQEVGDRMNAGSPVGMERLLVRKIGKTAIVATVDGQRVIVRIPRSTVAGGRAARNFAALQQVHASPHLQPDDRALVPAALLDGSCGGFRYYVEEMLGGRETTQRGSRGSWDSEAVRFITSLHARTRAEVVVDDDLFARKFGEPLQRAERIARAHGVGKSAVFDNIRGLLQRVVGQRLPLVWSHGDFALGNCLYGPSGRLSAVVDWELFSPDGLPLLDLLQCMPVADESNSHQRWQRFDAVVRLLQAHSPMSGCPVLSEYADAFGLQPPIIQALLVMFWVDHVANRIDARHEDAIWMQKRVRQPLATFEHVFESARLEAHIG